MQNNVDTKKRLIGLNIPRVIAAVGTFLYHTYHNFDCRYGIADYYVMQSTFHMTTFFVLSGFVIFYSYNDYPFFEDRHLVEYIRKRFMSIFPEYFLIYTIWYYIGRNVTSLKEDFIAFPFQITLTFGFEYYPHLINWGAWFFSLIFLCYFFSPFLILLISRLSDRLIYISACIVVVLISFAPWLYVMVYNNFFIRFFEFYVGMVLAYAYLTYQKSIFFRIKEKNTILFAAVLFVLSFVMISYSMVKINDSGLNHTFLSAINIIMSSAIIYVMAHSKGNLTDKLCNNVVVRMLSDYSLEIFVGTFFSNHIYLMFFAGKFSGIVLILLSFFLNAVSTFLLGVYRYYIQILIRKNIHAYFAISGCFFVVVVAAKIFAK